MVLLPSHPSLEKAETRNMTWEEISEVRSEHMRGFFVRKKQSIEKQNKVLDDVVE
jgi:hypothetical protein